MKKLFTRRVRLYIYGVALAAVPVAIHYEIIEPEAGVIALPLVLALLNLTPDDLTPAPAAGTGRHRQEQAGE